MKVIDGLSITGTYTDPTDQTIPAGPHFLSSAGLEVWSPGFSRFPGASFWIFDTSTNRWLSSLAAPLAQQTDLPPFIAPGDGMFLRAAADLTLTVPEAALRLRYYHQDHLGSSSVLTDTAGQLVEEPPIIPSAIHATNSSRAACTRTTSSRRRKGTRKAGYSISSSAIS